MDSAQNNSLMSNGPADRKLWYVPDRRIRTLIAARRATGVAEWATGSHALGVEPDEQALFTALHTCAFREGRCAGDEDTASIERDSWFKRWHGIRERIVKMNMGLAYSMVRRLGSFGQDQDGQLSDAMLGLTRAVERFNPWRGYRFSTYACNVLVRTLMRRGRSEIRRRRLFPFQYDVAFERPSELPDSATALYAERLNRARDANLAGLTELEAKIIALRFPRNTDRRSTLEDIGEDVGLSKERVRQIERLALSKLRDVLEADPVLQ